MGDKPREKLPTKMYGSTPVFGAGDNPSAEDSEDYSTVRGGTLPPPAPPTTLSAPIMPRRPETTPRASRMAMAERVAQTLEEEGDPQMAEAVRTSVAPPPLSDEEKEEAARLSGYILRMEDDGSSLENTFEGPDSGEETTQPAEGDPIVVESSHDSEDSEDEPTQVVETGETEVATATATVGDDADSDNGGDADGEEDRALTTEEVIKQAKDEVDLPKPVEPEAKVEDSWGMDEKGSPSPDDIPTLSPPPSPLASDEMPTMKMRISVQRAARIRERFPNSQAEDGAPFLIQLDNYGMVRCPLADGDTIVIGRSPMCDVVVDKSEESVSARHAMIKRDGDDCFICDCESLNGTYVNGVRVLSDAWYELLHADKLFLGNDKISIFFSDSKKPKRAPAPGASPRKGGKMTENDMKAPTVELPVSQGDTGADTDGGEVNTSPEVVSEEPVAPGDEASVDPNAEKAVVADDDKASRHVAQTVPLEVDLPEVKPETVPDNTAPPTPPPLPKEEKKQEERKTSLAVKVVAVFALLFFFIIGFMLIIKNPAGNVPAESTTMVTDIEKAPVDGKPMPAKEAGTVQFTAVDVLTRMEPLVDGPLGWTPEDPNGPLADIVMGKRVPRSSGDCFPEISPAPPELDALHCCLVLGNAGDVEEIAKCVGMSTVTQLRLHGNLPQ